MGNPAEETCVTRRSFWDVTSLAIRSCKVKLKGQSPDLRHPRGSRIKLLMEQQPISGWRAACHLSMSQSFWGIQVAMASLEVEA